MTAAASNRMEAIAVPGAMAVDGGRSPRAASNRAEAIAAPAPSTALAEPDATAAVAASGRTRPPFWPQPASSNAAVSNDASRAAPREWFAMRIEGHLRRAGNYSLAPRRNTARPGSAGPQPSSYIQNEKYR